MKGWVYWRKRDERDEGTILLKYTYQNLVLKYLDFLAKIRIRLEGWVEDYEKENNIIPMN